MRLERSRDFVIAAYRKAPGVASASPWEKRPFGVEVRLASGGVFRHSITRQRAPAENLEAAEEPVTGQPAPPVEPVPEPGGPRDRKTAAFLAAAVAAAGSEEIKRVYVYGEDANAGFGVECHSGARLYMLLV